MNQDIIALSIVFLAAAYAIYSTVKTLRVKSSGSCGDGCSCSAKSDFKHILKQHPKIQSEKLRMR